MSDYWKKPIGYTDINENRFSFVWKIDCLDEDTFINSNNCIRSSNFFDSCHQCDWFLELRYQAGYSNPLRKWISSKIFFSMTFNNRKENISNQTQYYYRFNILDEKSKVLYIKENKCDFNVVTKSETELMETSKLFDKNNKFVVDGTLILLCDVIAFQNQDYVTDNIFKHDINLHKLQAHNKLGLFLRDKIITDVTLIAKDERIEAHKIILASQSSVFFTMLKDDFQNKKENIKIEDFSADTVKGMLSFIYTGNVESIDRIVHDLLSCADTYSILGLKETCAQFLGNTLSLENVIDNLLFADVHKCDSLKNKISNFILTHKKSIIDKPQFKTLVKSHPALMANTAYNILSNSSVKEINNQSFKPFDDTTCYSNYYSFLWKIEHLHKDIHKNLNIKSPKFSDCVHKCDWLLKLDVQEGSKVTLFFTLENNCKSNNIDKVEYFYEFAILDDKFEKLHKRRGSYIFENGKTAEILFIDRNKLFDATKNFIMDGTLTICCNISTVANQDYEKHIGYAMDESNQQLEALDNLAQFLEGKLFTDVTLVTKEENIEAHKVILASKSEVFQAMFENDMKEKVENIVKIEDFSADVVNEMLSFIYTCKVKNIDKLAHDLLRCADKYLILDLKEICEQFISSTLSCDNVIDILLLSGLHSCVLLQRKLSCFIVTHKSVIDTSEFKELLKSNPAALSDVLFEVILQNSEL